MSVNGKAVHDGYSPEVSPYALEMDRVSKWYGDEQHVAPALWEVNLGLVRGGATAVFGPPGSGRSTLLGCATGRVAPTSGWVSVHDHVVEVAPEGWDALPPVDPARPELLVADGLERAEPLYAALGSQDAARTLLFTTGSAEVAAAADIVLFLVRGRLVDAMCNAPAATVAAHLADLVGHRDAPAPAHVSDSLFGRTEPW